MADRLLDSEQIMQLRREYAKRGLDEKELEQDPVKQFEKWFKAAVDEGLTDPNAMTLSTVSGNGKPSGRIVLLKDFDAEGFVFFTNYDSQKGQEIARNSFVSMVFYWSAMERQVRIEGKAQKISEKDSEEYFHSRPFESQIGALASKQSKEIPNREYLEKLFNDLKELYEGSIVPKPESWGGYRVEPDRFEFWQGRTGRLHDRIVYNLEGNHWKMSRLSP